jgi:hypothetical protein
MIINYYGFFISLFGIGISLCLILRALFSCKKEEYDVKLKNRLKEWLNDQINDKDKMNIIFEDYRISNEELGRRDNIVLLGGTILISASLLIVAESSKIDTDTLSKYAFASIGLFLIWLLFLHETAKKLDDITYNKIKAIERTINEIIDIKASKKNDSEKDKDERKCNPFPLFGIHTYTHENTNKQTSLWLRFRRTFWYVVLLVLSLAWISFFITFP